MAQGRVDLRKLYNTLSADSRFNAEVAAALDKAGVPEALLTLMDYRTAARTLAPPPEHAARPASGGAAARSISPSGPSLAGP
jgi:hypothetical protein